MDFPQPATAALVLTLETLEFGDREKQEGHQCYYYPRGEQPRFVFTNVPEDQRGIQRLMQSVKVPVIDEDISLQVEVSFRPRTGQVFINFLEPDKPYRLPDCIKGDPIPMWIQGAQTNLTYSTPGGAS